MKCQLLDPEVDGCNRGVVLLVGDISRSPLDDYAVDV